MATDPQRILLEWLNQMQAIAQNGLYFATCPFDKQRYESLLNLAINLGQNLDPTTPHHTIEQLFTNESGYATPRTDVRGAVFQEDKILLVKESSDGLWSLPGGWADINESPRLCVEKEVFEETGFLTRAQKLIGLLDKQQHAHPPQWPHTYKAFFLCEIVGGQATPSIETSEVAFFSRHALPELSTPRVIASQIERCFEHYDNPKLPTDFD